MKMICCGFAFKFVEVNLGLLKKRHHIKKNPKNNIGC